MRNSRKYSRCLGLLCGLILVLCGSGSDGWGATLKIEGTTNVEDVSIRSGGNADKNYGGSVSIWINSTDRVLIRVQNLSSLLPADATITACVCSLYCTVNTADGGIRLSRILKPWVEGTENGVDDNDGDATWNDWASDDYEWGAAGASCANDDGVDNNQDGICDATGRDTKSTLESTVNVTTVNTWYAFPVSAALAQDWYDGDANENGVLMIFDGSSNNTFASTEGLSNKPFWTVTYTVAGGGRRNREIRSKLRGGIDEEDLGFHARLDPVDYRQ